VYSYTHIYTHLIDLSAFGMAFGGGLFAFIVLNSFPAKIFMGDTGSLSIGGVLGILAVFSGNTLYLLLIGIVYVISGASVIMQVIYFKLTHKRIFLMAPFHHHLERIGIHENKIVAIYTVISVLVAMVSIIFYVR
ncbi:MAG: phospho-N-acetylmuramoyl-pentapeptide-transferase, partial [Clostridia bacterium]|nr:phospho-N-acetylmuramoyl-pentapeptide-transferase [Clostridia bacterium]